MNMNDELKMNAQNFELTDDDLEAVVGGFTEGETLMLKSGRTACSECGMRNITPMVYCGNGGSLRMELVTPPCGHQTYIPERALQST